MMALCAGFVFMLRGAGFGAGAIFAVYFIFLNGELVVWRLIGGMGVRHAPW
jgi:hypothetical protein